MPASLQDLEDGAHSQPREIWPEIGVLGDDPSIRSGVSQDQEKSVDRIVSPLHRVTPDGRLGIP
jgi:hypothetical protein